jgi:hypothetical protein
MPITSEKTKPVGNISIRKVFSMSLYGIIAALRLYSRDLELTEQYLRSVLHKNTPPYPSVRDAYSSVLGINYFGTPAFSPFIMILAPIYVRIEDAKLEKEKILTEKMESMYLTFL